MPQNSPLVGQLPYYIGLNHTNHLPSLFSHGLRRKGGKEGREGKGKEEKGRGRKGRKEGKEGRKEEEGKGRKERDQPQTRIK